MNNIGKTALVTGGSAGIGKAIAAALLRAGFTVYICGRKLPDLVETCAELAPLGSIHYCQLDIADLTDIDRFVRDWRADLHVLVNNAGTCGIERLTDNLNLWDTIINTNLRGLYFLTKGLIKYVQPGGSIINISSQLGVEGRAGFGAYCASKHAVIGLTKCWASELGERGITVNAVCPGWVKTAMAMADVEKMAAKEGITNEQMLSRITDKLDLKRFVEPDEIALLVAFLASEKARAITGQSHFIK